MGQAFITRRAVIKAPSPSEGYSTIGLENIPLLARLTSPTIFLEEPVSNFGCTVTSTQAVIAGGKKNDGSASNVVNFIDDSLFVRNPAPLTQARYNCGCAQVGGRTVIVGGEDGNGNSLASVETYTLTATHMNFADLSVPVTNPAVIEYNNYVVSGGGFNYSTGKCDQHVIGYAYDGATKGGSTLVSARTNITPAVFQGFLLFISGRNSSGDVVNTIDAYDTNLRRIATLHLSTAREKPCVVATNDYLFIAGGKNNLGKPLNSIEVFNKDLAPTTSLGLDYLAENLFGFEYGGYAYFGGGNNEGNIYSNITAIGPDLEKYSFLATSVPRSSAGAAKVGPYILIPGGRNSDGALNSVDIFKKFDNVLLVPGTKYKLEGMEQEIETNSMISLNFSNSVTGEFKVTDTYL